MKKAPESADATVASFVRCLGLPGFAPPHYAGLCGSIIVCLPHRTMRVYDSVLVPPHYAGPHQDAEKPKKRSITLPKHSFLLNAS